MSIIIGDAQGTVTAPDGIVHVLDGERTVCGLSATGWSQALTLLQMVPGLVEFCPACTRKT